MHGTIGMLGKNRKGRKRKSGRRTASGALVRKAPFDFRAMAANQPHRRGLPEALRTSEKAGSVIGCLYLLKLISEQQYEAGRRYSAIVGAYIATLGSPTGTSGGGRGFDCPADQFCRDKPELCPCTIRRNRYDLAFCAISDVGRESHLAINRVVLDEQIPNQRQVEALKLGLTALAKHFGLTNQSR